MLSSYLLYYVWVQNFAFIYFCFYIDGLVYDVCMRKICLNIQQLPRTPWWSCPWALKTKLFRLIFQLQQYIYGDTSKVYILNDFCVKTANSSF